MTARIYVASLADYTHGELHGTWINLSEHGYDANRVQDSIDAMLTASPSVATGEIEAAEEVAIHDHDGFQGVRIGEHENLERVCGLASLIDEHGEAFAVYLTAMDTDGLSLSELQRDFSERYQGQYRTLGCYADAQLDEWAQAEGMSTQLAMYLDPEKFARTLRAGGEVYEQKGHVFLAL